MDRSDAELVRAAQTGDDDAFEALLWRHYDSAFAIALALAGDRDEAEDVVQDAFVRAWGRIGQCRKPEKFRAWLGSVVRSVALNRLQSRKRRRQTPLDTVSLTSDSASPAAAAEGRELRERLEAALRGLPEVQREAVVLYDLEGWSHAEVAELLGISVLMSRRHVSDGRKALREALGRDHDGEEPA